MRIWIACSVGILLATPLAAAQDLQRAAFGTLALANVYRAEDQSFGTGSNLGGGIGLEWKRLGLDAELHGTSGLTPREVRCAVGSVPCVGTAREGVSRATMLSANVNYFVADDRLRPFVTGSVGVLWTEALNSLTVVRSEAATLSEFTERSAGLALGVGAGVDVALTSALSLRPEFRTYSSVALSRANLGLHRLAVGVRYRW